jgi:hypothetical protein
MTPIIVAVVRNAKGKVIKTTNTFVVIPESWEKVPTTLAKLTKEWEKGTASSGYRGWGSDRLSFAENERKKGNSITFHASIV